MCVCVRCWFGFCFWIHLISVTCVDNRANCCYRIAIRSNQMIKIKYTKVMLDAIVHIWEWCVWQLQDMPEVHDTSNCSSRNKILFFHPFWDKVALLEVTQRCILPLPPKLIMLLFSVYNTTGSIYNSQLRNQNVSVKSYNK